MCVCVWQHYTTTHKMIAKSNYGAFLYFTHSVAVIVSFSDSEQLTGFLYSAFTHLPPEIFGKQPLVLKNY